MPGIVFEARNIKMSTKTLPLSSSSQVEETSCILIIVIAMCRVLLDMGTFQSLQKAAGVGRKIEGSQILCLSKLPCSAVLSSLEGVQAPFIWSRDGDATFQSCLGSPA